MTTPEIPGPTRSGRPPSRGLAFRGLPLHGLASRVLAAVALVAVARLPVAAQAPGEGGISLAYGTQAPDAELQDLDGNVVQLLDYVRGKPAILEFWATWCPLCEELQPQLDRLQEEHGDRLAIVAVGVGVNQNPRRIQRHLEENDPGYPHLFDARGAAVRAYEAVTTSIVVMLDAEGKVVYTGVGAEQDLVGVAEERLLGDGGQSPASAGSTRERR